MPYTPSSDAQNTATLAGSNEASLTAPITALQSSIAGGNLAPAAFIDAILSASGTVLESNNALTTGNYTLSPFLDIAGTSITFTAPIAKKYTVHADFSAFFSVAGYGFVRLVVSGSAGPSIIIDQSGGTFNYHTPIHLMHNAACGAGANTIKLQWSVSVGTINTSALDYANFLVHG